MAKLLAYYNLCPINNLNEFLGLSEDVDSGSVINTLGKNIVLIFKLSNQKQLKSWTVLEKFSSKVVYDLKSKQYIGVFANRGIRCWSEDHEDINNIKKIKFYRNIYDLFTIPNNDNTLVVYDDGTCESFESALQTRKIDKLDPKRNKVLAQPNSNTFRISNVHTYEINERPDFILLTYFIHDIADETIELHYFPIDSKTLKAQDKKKIIKITRPEQNVQLLSYTVVQGTYFPSLITVWSDKRVFLKSLHYEFNSDVEQHGNFITLFDFITLDQSIAMIGIHKDCIAIYTANENKDGATLILYNIQFKVIQSKQYFKVYFKNSKFWLIDNNILLAAGQTLGVFPFRISKEQLSDMIGSQKVNQFSVNPVIKEYINEELEYEELMGFDEIESMANDEIGENEILSKKKSKKSKAKIFEDPEKITDELHSLYQENVIIDLQCDKDLPAETLQIKLFNSNVPELLILSEHFEVVVNDLERCGASEIEISERLIPLMIESNSTSDIGKSLQRFSTVSEKSIVKCLRYALECPEVQELDAEKMDLLSIILSCSYNRPNILPYLRNEIPFEAVLRLLNHLYDMIITDEMLLKENSTNCEEFDHDEKLIDWMNILIDAHYQQFVLTKDETCLNLLVKWQRVIAQNIDLMVELSNLEPILSNVLRGRVTSKKKQFSKWYSIENIQLY